MHFRSEGGPNGERWDFAGADADADYRTAAAARRDLEDSLALLNEARGCPLARLFWTGYPETVKIGR